MNEELEAVQEEIKKTCYAFYRYELNNGLNQLNLLVPQLSKLLSEYKYSREQLEEINQLLQMVLVAVEKKDFLIAADLLKYELLERILQAATSSE